ncbi:ribokinase [Spirillospora sp. NPDC047279]|uniref:ribokinase n=1 Tax=Spirillospora sp. NPDC047279 TaxID=3155478 RepID=UPI0033C75D40
MTHEVVVVGSVNADLVVSVDRRPDPGETVLGSDLATYPGGKGANQAVAAARLGARTAIVARIGDDAHGGLLRDALSSAGVDLAGLLVTEGPSGVALITVGPDGDNSIIVSPGANARLLPADLDPGLLSAAVVSFQLEIPIPTVVAAAKQASDTGARVVLNLSPATAVPDELLALCDPLVVNEHEAAFLLDAEDDAAAMAAALLERGPRSVVITLGADGALTADSAGVTTVPSPKVEAVDTTGAGDAFTAALCLRLARGDALPDAARYATRVGAAAVRRPGAQSSYPSADDDLPA